MGSTIATIDNSGANDAEFTYGPFGETSTSGSADASAPQYTGRENDGTGLYNYRARYYSPRLQRFISEDPIGFAGGSANLYAYVGNSPTNYRDPSGLVPAETFADVGFIIYDVYVLATDSEKNSGTNWLALAADIGGLVTPYATGFGVAVRAGRAVKGADHAVDAARGGSKFVGRHPNRIYSARELIRRAEDTGPFHNFPEYFNESIFYGNRQVVSDQYVLYTQRGTINGTEGTFEIGVRPSVSGRTEVITHRFFSSDR